MNDLLAKHGLTQAKDLLSSLMLPATGFCFAANSEQTDRLCSKFGGKPSLPLNFAWPKRQGRPLDFLLQIHLPEIASFSSAQLLPKTGVLSFFYDLENMPGGYDPMQLDGFRVCYFADTDTLTPCSAATSNYSMGEHCLRFYEMQTVPHCGSKAAEGLQEKLDLLEEDADFEVDLLDAYYNFSYEFESSFRPIPKAGNHHLFGHSDNVQGDMQLEAQLVTNGLYCGDPSGYNDPRAKELEAGADDWLLLLQLDSDGTADVLWGDVGMLYFWIRRQDLQEQRFDKVWMTMQCH
jgi:uncharacterized protein YwqG